VAGALGEVLTVARLRALAGPAFLRGQAYWRDGHVVSYRLAGGALDGVVLGGAAYHVRIANAAGQLAAACTCPVDAAVCKHAVAVGLAYLHADQPTVPVTAARRQPSGDDEPPAGGFATAAAVEAWAARHAVSHALARSADVLLDKLPPGDAQRHGIRYVLGRYQIGDLASHAGVRVLLGVRALEEPIADAACRELAREAAIVRAGHAEEGARAAHPPEPGLEPLWSRLVAARQALRAHAPPRSRAWRATGIWDFLASVGAVLWRERERVVRDRGPPEITARMTSPAGALELTCTCAAPGARCAHGVALIDATLDLLEDPDRRAEAHTLAGELCRPAWARLFQALDAHEVHAARPRPAIEVWWQIERVLGALTLTPLVKRQTKRGARTAGTRPTPAQLLDELRDSLSEVDRQIAEHLTAWQPPGRTASHARRAASYPWRAFIALAGHRRVLAEGSDAPIAVVRAALGFTAHQVGAQICLEPSLDGARLHPEVLAAALAGVTPGEPMVIDQPELARCMIVDVGDPARQLWSLLTRHGASFPPESHPQLLERLARLEARVPIVVPRALLGAELGGEAVTVARLRLLPDVTLELELWIRPGPGAPLFQPGSGPRDVLLARDGERGYVRRALADEPARARAHLVGLPLDTAEEGPPFCYRVGDADAALTLVAALEAPPPGLEVEWLDARPAISRGVGAEALRVQVERKRDWFGIAGELTIEAGRLELAVLLDAARRQQRFVRVDDRRWVELSDRLRERLLAVADQTFVGRHQLELSPGAVPAIRALAEAGAVVDAALDWRQLTERLAAAMATTPIPPAGLAATLRDYQLEGHAWLSRLAAWGAGACLADDMGLGKTVQAIAVLLDRAQLGPALVLAPTSVAFNWVHELARFAPGLHPVRYADAPDRAACLARLTRHDVVIVSYGLLARDAEQLAATRFATLVIDEAQALKNPATRRARAARQLDAGFRIALSGTPLENHLGELWSLFATVFPGLLGSWDQFRDRFAGPIERAKDPEARAALARLIRPFLLRRTKHEVARELPSRTEIEVPIALSRDERALYEDARLAAVAELGQAGKRVGDPQRRFQILAALTRLRLLACHPRLYDGRSPVASSKLRRLLELVDELRAEGHRALVFSQFTAHLALARAALDDAGHRSLYLDGATPERKRAQLVAAFQAGEGDVFLISLKAGGTGINLTAADNVIHLDPWWNPAVEDQASDRAHRIGQTRPVTVYRLIARGTIEEQILALHGDKRALVAGVLDGSNAAARLTTQDLLGLLAAAPGASTAPGVGDDDGDD
jgi:superfamily II DNA or RNA helicase